MVLMTDGTIYGTGYNYYGQLGIDSNTDRNILTQMTNNTGKTPKEIGCGEDYTLVLMTDGTIYGTGNNQYGQLGFGSTISTTTLKQLTNNTGKTPTKIGCGNNHSMILMTDGSIYGCGYNKYGQIGNSSLIISMKVLHEMTNTTGKTPQNIVCSYNNTFVIMTDDSVYGCGLNTIGQLGNGKTKNELSIVELLEYVTTKQPICGSQHVMLFTNDTLYGCGKNNQGQLGDGSQINKQLFSTINMDVVDLLPDVVGVTDISGYSVSELKNTNYTLDVLKNDYSIDSLKSVFTLPELKEEITLTVLKDEFSLTELKDASFSLVELKDVSFSLTELKDVSFSLSRIERCEFFID